MNQNLTPSLIKDIRPGTESSNPRNLIGFNGELYFTTNFDLWTSNGTTEGTLQIDEETLFSSSPPSAITDLITFGDRVLGIDVSAGGNLINNSIFATDFTPEETVKIFSFGSDSRLTRSEVNNFTTANDDLFFVSNFIDNSSLRIPSITSSLIKTDGTKAGTSPVKTFDLRGGGSIKELTNVNGTLFFTVPGTLEISDGLGELSRNNELWKSNGTEAGTVIVKDIIPGNNSSNPNDLTDINGTLFFTANDGSNGRELWKSDGTQEGTVVIKDINPGETSSNPDQLTDVNGTAFFTADDGTNGTELWKSDGTESGTVLVEDITPGSQGSEFNNFTNVNGTLFFTVNDGSNGTELWKSDGTESGTSLVEDINPGGSSSNPDNLTNFDGILYFTADDGSNGVELWKSDGTESGTVLVGDINEGSGSSSPEALTVVDGELYFSADDGVNGRELWGLTEGGTQPNQDLILGGDSNDVLEGKEQDNIIDGLKGDDTLTGGVGKDKFVLSEDFGSDVITDFTLGEDEIVNATDRIVLTVASIGDAVNVAFSNTSDVLQVNLNGNDQAGLENYLLNIGSNQALPY